MPFSAQMANREIYEYGQGIVMQPSTGKYSNVVIWLHGLGDTADGWFAAFLNTSIQLFSIISLSGLP